MQLLEIFGKTEDVSVVKCDCLWKSRTLMKYWLSDWDIPHSNWSIQTWVIDENVLFLDENLIRGLQVSASGNTSCFVLPKHLSWWKPTSWLANHLDSSLPRAIDVYKPCRGSLGSFWGLRVCALLRSFVDWWLGVSFSKPWTSYASCIPCSG